MKDKSALNFAIPLLPCVSIKETLEFYQAMDCQITYQQKAPNNYLGIKLKGVEIHFFGLKQIKPDANFSTCYLVVDDIDVFYNLCRDGLQKLYGKIPVKGIPRINQIKDMPTYGVRQFIIVDPSGNYIRIGQPIPKTDSVLFEANGKKPQPATALKKAYELADRLANGKEDLEAAIKVIDKALSGTTEVKELADLFRLITLGVEIGHRTEDVKLMKRLIGEGKKVLDQLDEKDLHLEDLANFRQFSVDIETPNR